MLPDGARRSVERRHHHRTAGLTARRRSRERHRSHDVTPTRCPSWSRTSRACSRAWPGCSPARVQHRLARGRARPRIPGLAHDDRRDVDGKPLEQVTKQLNKLINVIKIVEHGPATPVERELMLVKVAPRARCGPRPGDRRRVPRRSRRRHAPGAHDRGDRLAGQARGASSSCWRTSASSSSPGPGGSRSRGELAASVSGAQVGEGGRRRGRRRGTAGGVYRTNGGRTAAERTPRKDNDHMATIYYEKDADRRALAGRQNRAILGFGSARARARAEPPGLGSRRPGWSASGVVARGRWRRTPDCASLDTADAVREATS